MKKLLLLAAVSGMLLSFAHEVRAQATNVVITIRVNTETINDTNVNQQVSLEDSNGNSSPFGADHSQFLSNVFSEGFVDWVGVANDNSSNTVEIKKISKKSGSQGQVLKKSTYRGSGNRLQGQVKKFEESDPEEDYDIEIKVTTSSGNSRYTIDPKLKVNR